MQDPGHQNQSSITSGTEIQTAGLFRDLIEALSGVIPVLDKIKETIEESAGKIPSASRQLDNVTKATESATVEILNVLDVMTRNIDQAEGGLQVIAEAYQRQQQTLQKVLSLLQNSSDPALVKAAEVASQDGGTEVNAADTLAGVRTALTCAKDRSIDIAMALQVQDITTQQIAGVTHMIESVRTQLGRLFAQMTETGVEQFKIAIPPPSEQGRQSFDTNAQYTPSADRQGGADAIVEQWNKPRHG